MYTKYQTRPFCFYFVFFNLSLLFSICLGFQDIKTLRWVLFIQKNFKLQRANHVEKANVCTTECFQRIHIVIEILNLRRDSYEF